MNAEEKRVWGIHTKNDYLFLNNSIIAIRWKEMGDLSRFDADRDKYKAEYARVYPEAKKASIATAVGMLYRFANEIQIGDYIVFPSKTDRQINIGIVEGEYVFVENENEYAQQRKVKWLKHLPRTVFSQGALYEVGAAQTLFSVKNYAEEYLKTLDREFNEKKAFSEPDETVGATADEIIESTKDFILKELSKNLKGYDLEEFVADMLRAMGYRTERSPRGGDRGIDLIAYKDELPPRIVVQVKSQDSDIKEATIQSLKGAMSEGDYGLFVTLSNYTKNAQKYLDSKPMIRGINGTQLVELILKYYDQLSEKHKKMIPLKMVYIPIQNEE